MDSSQLRHRTTTGADKDVDDEQKEESVKYTGPPLLPFKTPNGKFFAIGGIIFGGLLRALNGVFVEGYRIRFRNLPAKEGEYKTPFKFFGKELLETSNEIPSMKRPDEPIIIYEFEACPYCKKVREATTRLDLDILFYPTPKNAPNHRSKVKELGGKEQFPYMVDPNTGISMYESSDIVKYLYKEYGNGKVPWLLNFGFLTTLTCTLAGITRSGRGKIYRKAKYPDQHLVFWGYELSPFTKIVREVLVELELPFLQIYCARGSPNRQQMMDKHGAFQAPLLEDPNTGTKLFESVKIIKYLEDTYAL
eukprot:g5540.t1